MLELGPYGSVRGARGNSRPYREPRPISDIGGVAVSQRTQPVGTSERVTANNWREHFLSIFNSQRGEIYAIALRDVTHHE